MWSFMLAESVFFDPCHLLVPIPFPMPLWTLEKHSEFSTPAPVTPLRSRWYIEREGRGRCRCVGTTRMPVSFVSLICSHLYYVYSFGQVICLLYVTKLSILVRRITASDEATCSPLNLPQISKFIEKERKKTTRLTHRHHEFLHPTKCVYMFIYAYIKCRSSIIGIKSILSYFY